MSPQFQALKTAILSLKESKRRAIEIAADLQSQLLLNSTEKDGLISSLRDELNSKSDVIARISSELDNTQGQLVAALADDAATAEAQQAAAIALFDSNARINELKAAADALEVRVADSQAAVLASNELTASAQATADAALADLAANETDLAGLIDLINGDEPEVVEPSA